MSTTGSSFVIVETGKLEVGILTRLPGDRRLLGIELVKVTTAGAWRRPAVTSIRAAASKWEVELGVDFG